MDPYWRSGYGTSGRLLDILYCEKKASEIDYRNLSTLSISHLLAHLGGPGTEVILT